MFCRRIGKMGLKIQSIMNRQAADAHQDALSSIDALHMIDFTQARQTLRDLAGSF